MYLLLITYSLGLPHFISSVDGYECASCNIRAIGGDFDVPHLIYHLIMYLKALVKEASDKGFKSLDADQNGQVRIENLVCSSCSQSRQQVSREEWVNKYGSEVQLKHSWNRSPSHSNSQRTDLMHMTRTAAASLTLVGFCRKPNFVVSTIVITGEWNSNRLKVVSVRARKMGCAFMHLFHAFTHHFEGSSSIVAAASDSNYFLSHRHLFQAPI